jgi:SAM-dependent methyltransferase
MRTDPPAEFDAYDRNYNEVVDTALSFSGLTVDFFTRVKADYFLELLASSTSSLGKCPDVIDIGCGIANLHPLLAGHVGRMVGVDVSAACIATAAARNPQNEYVRFDGLNLPYPAESFDAASAVCVFHHVPRTDRVRLASDVRRVLRPGGAFVIFEHNPLNPLTLHVVSNCEFDKDAVLLRRRETERLLGEAGFREISTRFILSVPAKGRVLRRIDRLFARLPVGAQYYSVARA